MKVKFKNLASFVFLSGVLLLLVSCVRYGPAAMDQESELGVQNEELSVNILRNIASEGVSSAGETGTAVVSAGNEEESSEESFIDTRTPTRVKGIYLASKPLSNESFMSTLWDYMDTLELNAVVIDIKDDYGKITFDMQDVPIVDELSSVEISIEDLPKLMSEFKTHDIYTIARIVSFRDPYVANVRPDWCLTNADGTLYEDNSGYNWINPYKTEYWDYLLQISLECARIGFDEIQFDYLRFCTDRGADDCVYDEAEVMGRDKISIITECVQYLTDSLLPQGVYVSCDVFGTIILSQLDSRSVGQDYPQLANIVDYMCPMIYPSHYSSGNFDLDMPDKHPYEAIRGALRRSRLALSEAATEGAKQAIVRPWLQAFTATWLGNGNYINYGADEIREEIQAVYDSGYDEWILWSASVSYDFSLFLTEEEADAEDTRIEESRAALPDEILNEEETFPEELADALDGDQLYESDAAILSEDGPIITYDE